MKQLLLPAKTKSPEGWKDTERTLCVSCIATNTKLGEEFQYGIRMYIFCEIKNSASNKSTSKTCITLNALFAVILEKSKNLKKHLQVMH